VRRSRLAWRQAGALRNDSTVKLQHWCGFAGIFGPGTAPVLEFGRDIVAESVHCRTTRIDLPSVCPAIEDHQGRAANLP